MVGLNKLCSILVEDEDACMSVIDANRRLKGGQINIIQLNYLRRNPVQTVSAPKNSGVHKLSSNKYIKLYKAKANMFNNSFIEDLDKLIKNTF